MKLRAVIAGWTVAVAIAMATGTLARAQLVRPPRLPPREPRRPPPVATADESTDLRARFGVDRAARLVRSSDAAERLRGLERAAAIGSPEAVALLVDALESARPTHDDPRARMAIARGLAAHTDQGNARTALLLVVGSPAPRRARDAEEPDGVARFELARRIAALALAQSRDARSIDSLAALARGTGPGAAAAAFALVELPPQGATSAWARPMTASALRLAARTGDLRALEPTLEAARSGAGDAATRAAAIEALGALGDARVIPLATSAMVDPDARMRAAAGAALAALGAPQAADAVERLLADDATASRGIALASDVHSAGIVRALAARAATSADPAVRGAAIAALGRDPGREAVVALLAFVRDPMVAAEATSALARSPSDQAAPALEGLAEAKDGATRRLAVKGYAVRAIVRGERRGSLDRAAAAMAAASDAGDRATGVFARVALGDLDAAGALRDPDPAVRRAAALGALARREDDAREPLLDRLGREEDPLTRRILAAGLAGGDPTGRAPTRALLACARAGGADAAMCALAFARRASASELAEVDALLATRDPLLRAHAARGLGRGDDPTRAGRLAAAYAYEIDPLVRRAVVLGLGRAPDAPSSRDTLALAARLDPDAATRAAAARALAGAPPLADDRAARDVAWVRLVDASGAPPAPGASGTLVGADGLAVPVAFDADGDALVPGLPAGSARLVLAPRLDAAYAPTP